MNTPFSDTDVTKLRDMLAADEPWPAIAEALGRTLLSVRDKARRCGFKRPAKAEFWTQERWAECIRMLQTGWLIPEIAERLGCTVHAVHYRLDAHGGANAFRPRSTSDSAARMVANAMRAAEARHVIDAAAIPEDELSPTATLGTIRWDGCRHVIGDPFADDPAMCGRTVPEGSAMSWCADHRKRFTQVGCRSIAPPNITGRGPAALHPHADAVLTAIAGRAE
jgi:hypothetical protein